MILDNLFENQPAASGSAYDRGGADAWYHRGRHPHKIVDGREVALTDPEEIADYNRGYDDEGIEGRHQGKQYDVREETSDSCDAFRHNLRQQVQQRAAGDQADLERGATRHLLQPERPPLQRRGALEPAVGFLRPQREGLVLDAVRHRRRDLGRCYPHGSRQTPGKTPGHR